MSADVMPFVRPQVFNASFGTWQLADGEVWVPLPQYLPDWDYQTDLILQRRIDMDVAKLLRESQLPCNAPVSLVVEWRASAAQTAGSALNRPLADSEASTINVTLRGSELGGRLTLITRVVLADDMSTLQPFIANRAGDVLFDDLVTVELQGEAGRFPIYVADFAAHGLDADARWHLEIASDPGHAAAGGVRLFLNKNDNEIVGAAVRAANPTPVQKRLLEWLSADLTRQLIDRALSADWRDALIDCLDDPESIGASLLALVSNLFDGEPIAVIAKLRETDSGRFASRLQGALNRSDQGVEL